MNISSTQHGNVNVIQLPQRLVMANARTVRNDLLETIAQGHKYLVLDLAEVAYVDSSGLSVLVSALKATSKAGGNVVLLNLSNDVRALVELTRMHEVFDIFANEAAAIEQLTMQAAA